MTGKDRRTVGQISYYPDPQELHRKIISSPGWPYRTNLQFYKRRDKALTAILYLLALRVSEALRLTKEQFEVRKDHVVVKGILLSKLHKKGKKRKHQYRAEGFLPLTRERQDLTLLILQHIDKIESGPVFASIYGRAISTVRAWQIVSATLQIPCHWLRAYGEDFLYTAWKHDLLAVADYVKVDETTLAKYIRKSYLKYPRV